MAEAAMSRIRGARYRFSLAALLALAALLFFGVRARAGAVVPLAAYQSNWQFICNESFFQGNFSIDFPRAVDIQSNQCTFSGSSGACSGEGVARTGLEFAVAGAFVRADTPSAPLCSFTSNAGGRYQVGFTFVKEFPFVVSEIPITVTAGADVLCGGLCGQFEATIDITQGGVRHLFLTGSREEQFPLFGTVDVRLRPDETMVVDLLASCFAFIATPNTPASDCTMFTDPTWEFDQEAFDAEWGAASFPLDQHLAFAFSDVPEPGGPALLAIGVLALAGGRALGRRRR
jgi:hypothetical protein